MREIEIKLKVSDLDELEKKFTEKGWKFSEPIDQHDVIYDNNPAEFLKSSEGHVAIRIRREKGIAKLTLKQQKTYEMDNLEYESEVKHPEEVHKILMALGWNPEVEVRKTRRKGRMGEYEISLDRVESLGEYVELEKMTNDDADPEIIRKELFDILKPFGLSEKDEETKGYDTQMYLLKNKSL